MIQQQQNINTRPSSHIRSTVSQPTEDEYDKWLQAVVQASSLVKLIDGCANNAAWMACLDAYEYLKPLPRFRQQVKGGDTAGYGYQRVFKAFKNYQRNLIYTSENRFFQIGRAHV